MSAVWRDIQDAVRALLRRRAYAAASVATLTLGIGATTAIFTVVNTVVLRPLPFPAPEQLVQLFATPPERGEAIAFPHLHVFRTESASLDGVAAYAVSARFLRGRGEPQRVMVAVAERGLFGVLGVAPLAGRTFRPDDPQDVAVVRESFATARFGDVNSAVGATLLLDEEVVTIVGVMAESFQFPYSGATTLRGVASETRTDMWLPMYALNEPLRGRATAVVARLKPSVSLHEAASELAVIAARLDMQSNTPETRGRGIRLQPLSDAVVPTTLRRSLFFLFAAVGIVLALACANVMNLSLVQTMLRTREVAVHAAMGASPWRIARRFAIENLLLSLAGGAAGLWLATFATSALVRAVIVYMPRAREVGVDWVVFVFLLTVCTITGVAFGLASMVIARKVDPQSVLREHGSYGTAGVAHRRFRDALVAAEVALAFILVVASGVLLRELIRLQRVDAGFASTNVVTLHLGHRMTAQSDVRQFSEIADRVGRVPGVRAAGFTQMLPLQHWGWQSVSSDFRVAGRPSLPPSFAIEMRYVTPGYLEAMGMTLGRGRWFTEGDRRDAPPVIVINETLAGRYFPAGDAVGRQTSRGTIVGVVRDVRQVHLDRPVESEIYFPAAQNWSQVSELGMTLVVRTHDRPESMASAIRAAIREANPNIAIFNFRTLEDVVAESLSPFTLYLRLIAAFAALALVLATIGTYAVMSYVVTARSREFAIRLAVGAQRRAVIALLLLRTARLAALGLVAGFVVLRLTAPLLHDLPVDVHPPDLTTAASMAFFIGVVALCASFVPARRAAGAALATLLRQD